jgi:hypothetical protein
MRDVDEMEQMTEPRIIKSHLPLYLLNPKLLDTSKVKFKQKYENSLKFKYLIV